MPLHNILYRLNESSTDLIQMLIIKCMCSHRVQIFDFILFNFKFKNANLFVEIKLFFYFYMNNFYINNVIKLE